jgi:hypothetical protein
MLNCPDCVDQALPNEYRAQAAAVFPHQGYTSGEGPTPEALNTFAEILGIGHEYRKCLMSLHEKVEQKAFLVAFQNNLELLIQKTWVQRGDEERKDRLLDAVPLFIDLIEEGDYAQAIEQFGAILGELAYLFFGSQSTQDDFTEYTFRIDGQMGLFWWYGSRLASRNCREWVKTADAETLERILLLGICYLINF